MDFLKIPAQKGNFKELQVAWANSKLDNILEIILNVPGLQYLTENIFDSNLNFE